VILGLQKVLFLKNIKGREDKEKQEGTEKPSKNTNTVNMLQYQMLNVHFFSSHN
jgi:hypothetical protein